MSKTEDVLISAVLRGAGVRPAIKQGVNTALFQQRKAEWRFLEENPSVSRATFKARFPDFKLYKVDPEELEILVRQQQRNMADMELVNLFRKYQKMLGEQEPSTLTARLIRDLEGVINKYSKGNDVNIIEDWERIYSNVEQRALATQNGNPIGYPFDVPQLDEEFGGLMAPDLVTILARQGEMKTWLSLHFATSVMLAGGRPMYISLEMNVEQIALRVHTLLSRRLAQTYADRFKTVFSNTSLMRGSVNLKSYRKFLLRARRQVRKGFIVPDSKDTGSVGQIQAKMEEHKPDVVFYDYFGLDIGEGRVENWMEAEALCHGFKGLAKQYDIPVVLNAQASRKAADSKDHPQLDHAAYTDAIGRDSDRVLSLKLRKGELTCYVIKNRFGKKDFMIRFETDIDKGVLDEIVMSTTRRRRFAEEEDD